MFHTLYRRVVLPTWFWFICFSWRDIFLHSYYWQAVFTFQQHIRAFCSRTWVLLSSLAGAIGALVPIVTGTLGRRHLFLLLFIPANRESVSESRHHGRSASKHTRTVLRRSPDHLLVVVESLPGHIVDEGGVLQLQIPRDGQEERGGVQDVHLHLRLPLGCVLLVSTLWCHLGIRWMMLLGLFSVWTPAASSCAAVVWFNDGEVGDPPIHPHDLLVNPTPTKRLCLVRTHYKLQPDS